MKKSDLIKQLAAASGVSASAVERVLDNLVTITAKAIKAGDEVPLHGLGKIVPVKRKERVGRNPRTGEAATIPASLSAKLSVTKVGKDLLN